MGSDPLEKLLMELLEAYAAIDPKNKAVWTKEAFYMDLASKNMAKTLNNLLAHLDKKQAD